ncbi:MAG: DedA family protein [Deltaproteobacteria bacterium]|nr:DedA family protein [Deltaproteobacteria bacterium]
MKEILLALESHGYGVVFVGLTLDMMGLPFPGEIVLLWAGFLIFLGVLEFPYVVLLATAAVLIGESFTYSLGRLVGERGEKRLVEFYCRWTACTLGSAHCMEKTEGYLQRFRSWSLLFAKFLFGVRAFICPAAGMLKISYRKFLLFDLLGTIIWSSTFTFLGFMLGAQWHYLAQGLEKAQMVFGWITLFSLAFYLIFKIYKNRRYGSPPTTLVLSNCEGLEVGCRENLRP